MINKPQFKLKNKIRDAIEHYLSIDLLEDIRFFYRIPFSNLQGNVAFLLIDPCDNIDYLAKNAKNAMHDLDFLSAISLYKNAIALITQYHAQIHYLHCFYLLECANMHTKYQNKDESIKNRDAAFQQDKLAQIDKSVSQYSKHLFSIIGYLNTPYFHRSLKSRNQEYNSQQIEKEIINIVVNSIEFVKNSILSQTLDKINSNRTNNNQNNDQIDNLLLNCIIMHDTKNLPQLKYRQNNQIDEKASQLDVELEICHLIYAQYQQIALVKNELNKQFDVKSDIEANIIKNKEIKDIKNKNIQKSGYAQDIAIWERLLRLCSEYHHFYHQLSAQLYANVALCEILKCSNSFIYDKTQKEAFDGLKNTESTNNSSIAGSADDHLINIQSTDIQPIDTEAIYTQLSQVSPSIQYYIAQGLNLNEKNETLWIINAIIYFDEYESDSFQIFQFLNLWKQSGCYNADLHRILSS